VEVRRAQPGTVKSLGQHGGWIPATPRPRALRPRLGYELSVLMSRASDTEPLRHARERRGRERG
jgi:hypothetical protein